MRLSISFKMLNKWQVAFAFFFLRGSFIFSQDVEEMNNRERRAHAISLESYSDFLIKQSGYWTSEINGCKYELSQFQKDIEFIQSDNETADRSYDQLKKSIAENELRVKKLKKDIEFQKYVVDSLRFTAEAPIYDLSATNVGDRFNGALVIAKTQNSVLLASLSPIGSGSWDEAAALARNYKFGFCWWRLPSPSELELIFSMRDRLDSFENNWYWTDNVQGNMAEHIGISEGDHALVPKGHGKCVFAVTTVEGINGAKQEEKEVFPSKVEIEDKSIQTITIGNQVWMIKNLDVTKFRNGDPIPQAITKDEWIKAGESKQPAWCYYDNLPENGKKYGKLYNHYAVNDPRGLAPVGYHIPTSSELYTMNSLLETNTDERKSGAFSHMSSGCRGWDGDFFQSCGWWSSTEVDSTHAWHCSFFESGIWIDVDLKDKGQSVRCLKLIDFPVAKRPSIVAIGSQVWMTKDLDVSTFRNGDPIPQAKTNDEWKNACDNQQPAWCYPDNFLENGKKYGKFYNLYAVNDPRGLAPVGYHIPNEAEWNTMWKSLAGGTCAMIYLQDRVYHRKDCTNESGFSALLAGARQPWGEFVNIGHRGYWWTSSPSGYIELNPWIHNLLENFGAKNHGFSVRCMKD